MVKPHQTDREKDYRWESFHSLALQSIFEGWYGVMERKQLRGRIALVYKQFKYEGDGNREQVIHTLLSAPPPQKKKPLSLN